MRIVEAIFRFGLSVLFLFFIVISLASPVAAQSRFQTPLPQGMNPRLPAVAEPSSKAVSKEGAGKAMTMSSSSSVGFGSSAGGGDSAGISSPASDASIFTGAATNAIPIIVAPGRGGIVPTLTLQYNSYRDNSWVGRGWDLDCGAIQRSTKRGISYSANDYVAVKDGSHTELVPRSDWGADVYGTKIEGAFTKYTFNSSSGWQAIARDGAKYFYGQTAASRQDNANGVFKWCLDRVEDVHGNYLTVTYIKDQGEIYLERIDYTGSTHGLSPTNYVRFYLEDRPDKPAMYTTHAPVTMAKRLKSIEVVASNSRVRAYKLTYTTSSGTSRSLLARVQQFGSDATVNTNGDVSGGTTLPPIDLQYTAEASAFASNDYWGTSSYIHQDIIACTPDLNGDMKTDYVYLQAGTKDMRAMLSTGTGFGPDTVWGTMSYDFAKTANGAYLTAGFSDVNGDGMRDFHYQRAGTSRELRVMLSAGSSLGDDTSWGSKTYDSQEYSGDIADVNGDGKADLVYQRAGTSEIRVMLSTGSGFDDDLLWGNKPANSGTELCADMNGDGKTDLLYHTYTSGASTYGLWVMLSTGSSFAPAVLWGSRTVNASRWMMTDMNGDGKIDYFYIPTNTHQLWVMLSTGTGLGAAVLWGTKSYDFAGYYLANDYGSLWTLADMNGDGKADLVYQRGNKNTQTDTNEMWVKLSKGDSFGPDTPWGTKPYGTYYTDIEIYCYDPEYSPFPYLCAIYRLYWIWMSADVNGDGKTDLLYRSIGSTQTELHVMQSDENKTMLLSSFTNGRGALTSLEYTLSSDCQDTILPFVLHPVSRIMVDDGGGHQAATAYAYQGGRYDLVEMEFRGFEKVTATDEVTGIVTETHYHQDLFFQGRVAWSQTKDAAGVLAGRVDNTWEAIDYGNNSAFPYLTQALATAYDDGGASLGSVTTHYTYDDYGNVLTESKTTTDGYSRLIESQYLNDTDHWILGRPTQVEASGSGVVRETRLQYTNDSRRLLWKQKRVHNSAEYTTSYQYDSYGNVTITIDPRNAETITEYDANAVFPIRVTNALGHFAFKTFDPGFGVVLTETNANNLTTNYTYDVFGREIHAVFPDGSTKDTTYHIEPGNHYIIVQSSSAPDAVTFYDNLGRTIEEQVKASDGANIATSTQYDNAGRITAKSLPMFSGQTPEYTTFEYDLRSRLKKQTKPDGTYRQITYSGLIETTIDENSHSKTNTKDLLGRVKRVDEAIGSHAEYHYDIFDNLVWVKDPIGNETGITYDDLGRKIAMDDPYMGHWEYNYDAVDNLVWQKNAKNQEVVLQYDPINRPIQKDYTTLNRQIVYGYDEALDGYYNKGSLTTVAVTTDSPQVITQYNYDKMGRQALEKRFIDTVEYPISRHYDLAGRLDSITYPDGNRFDYAYHPIGHLKTVKAHSTGYQVALYANYNALGQVGSVAYGNGTTSTYQYWAKTYRPKTMITSDISGAVIQSLTYTSYDNVGNIITITDNHNSVTQSFTYDAVNRLSHAQATCSADPTREYSQAFTYDLAGNILQQTGKNAYQVIEQDSVGRPTRIDYSPEIADIGTRHVDYNQDDMPVRIVFKGQETTITYDGEDTRIKKVSATSTVIYVGGFYEIRNGAPLLHIFAGGKRIATVEGAGMHYFHTDHLSSTTVVTDQNGLEVEEMGYLPFGALLYDNALQGGQWRSVFRFTGQEYDAEFALYNYNARLYDPIMGRFISPDHIMQDFYNPQGLNRYAYCINNPLIYVDPTGHDFLGIGGFFSDVWGGFKSGISRALGGVSRGMKSIFGGRGSNPGGSVFGNQPLSLGSNDWISKSASNDLMQNLIPNRTDSIANGDNDTYNPHGSFDEDSFNPFQAMLRQQKIERIKAVNEQMWPLKGNYDNCSGDVRAVAQVLGGTLYGNANNITKQIQGEGWTVYNSGAAVYYYGISQGKYCIAGWPNPDPSKSGHVANLVDGPLAYGIYPTGYWGSVGSIGKPNKTINLSFTRSQLKEVIYSCTEINP